MKDFKKSFESFNRIVTKYPKSDFWGDSVYKAGQYLLKNQQYNETIRYFRDYIAKVPGSSLLDAANYQIGYAYFQLNKKIDALNYFSKVLNYPKTNLMEKSYLYIGRIQVGLKHFAEAKKALAKIIESNGKASDEAYFLMGKSNFFEGNISESKNNFNMLIKKYKQSYFLPDAYLGIGMSHLKENNTADAIAALTRVRVFYKSKSSVYEYAVLELGKVYEKKGKKKKALKYYNQLLKETKSDYMKNEVKKRIQGIK